MLGQPNEDLERVIAISKRVTLTFSLVTNGRYTPPNSKEQYQELFSLFPTTYAVDVIPPVLIIRVCTLPPRPWPLTVAEMPLYLTTSEHGTGFNRGFHGRGPRALTEIDLREDEYSGEILNDAIDYFTQGLKIGISSIAWLDTMWKIAVPDGTSPQRLPAVLANILCCYTYTSNTTQPDFGEVYHPEPQSGEVIGTVVKELGKTDVSVVRLNKGLKYVNETFKTANGEDGVTIDGISPGEPPHLRIGNHLSMNNPYSGFSEGMVIGFGARVEGFSSEARWIRHVWTYFENGDEPINGSCGSPILDEHHRLVSFFRFLEADGHAVSVSAAVLREFHSETCGGIQTF